MKKKPYKSKRRVQTTFNNTARRKLTPQEREELAALNLEIRRNDYLKQEPRRRR